MSELHSLNIYRAFLNSDDPSFAGLSQVCECEKYSEVEECVQEFISGEYSCVAPEKYDWIRVGETWTNGYDSIEICK